MCCIFILCIRVPVGRLSKVRETNACREGPEVYNIMLQQTTKNAVSYFLSEIIHARPIRMNTNCMRSGAFSRGAEGAMHRVLKPKGCSVVVLGNRFS